MGSAPQTASRSRTGWMWLGAFLAAALTLAAVNTYVFALLRQNVINQERAQLTHLADVASAAVDNLFRVTRISLDHIRAEYHRELPPFDMHDVLRRSVEGNPFVRAISIVGLDGRVVYSSRGLTPPTINLSQSEFVRYYAEGGNRSLYISGPNKNAFDGRWQITVNIPIRTESGGPIAIISAVVDPHYIYSELLSVSALGDFRVFLVDQQMRLVARSPWNDSEIGRSLANAEVIAFLRKPDTKRASGIFKSFFTGDLRVGAVQWLEDRNFALAVSRSLDSALSSWRTTRNVTAAGSAMVLALLLMSWRISTRAERRQAGQAAELARMNRELQAENARAEALAEAKSEFLATMSHEIRTPLNSVIGYSGVVLEDESLKPESRDYVLRVFEASNALRTIIDDILDFSKIEAGGLTLDPMPFVIHGTVDNCLSIVRPAAALKGIELECETAGDLPHWLMGDGMRLRQVLLNLLNNAVKFTDEGFVRVTLHGEAQADDRVAISITVQDTGIGIPADKIPLLFKRFSQADSSTARRFGGTGLGLAISKRIIEAMEGEIGVSSHGAGQGSTFWVRLTLPRADAPAQPESNGNGGAHQTPLKILVVDDHEMNRDLVHTLLTRVGHKVDLAESGSAALRMIRESRYDIVLMDIQMPGLDGMETTRQIRALGNGFGSLPIVAMTANVLPDQVMRYRSAGMVGHIGKPIDRRRLLSGLSAWAQPARAAEAPLAMDAPAAEVLDRSLFDDVLQMLGRERAMPFVVQMRATLTADHWEIRPGEDSADLRRTAHTMVTTAGQLGLTELSEACRTIDTCAEDELPSALATFVAARGRALAALDRLIAEMSDGSSGAQSPSAA